MIDELYDLSSREIVSLDRAPSFPRARSECGSEIVFQNEIYSFLHKSCRRRTRAKAQFEKQRELRGPEGPRFHQKAPKEHCWNKL